MSEDEPGASAASGVEGAPRPPLLRVITPDATDEEIAALVAVVSAMSGAEEAPTPPRPVWSAPARLHRSSPASGPGAWRASALPR